MKLPGTRHPSTIVPEATTCATITGHPLRVTGTVGTSVVRPYKRERQVVADLPRCRSDLSSAASAPVVPAQGFRSSAQGWQDHRYTLPVATVFVAEMRNQIALLEEDSDEDVSRGRDCKQQVAPAHTRCGPERQNKAQVDRVSHVPVERRRLERRWTKAYTPPVIEYLMQPEQLEVVDQKS